MERDILFRGKTIIGGKWVQGDLSRVVHNDGRCYVFPADGYDSPDFYEVDPDTVGLYTGLADKNGQKIFKGDIVLVSPGFIEDIPFKFEVRYGPCGGVKNVEHNVGYIGFFFDVITSDSCIKTWLRTDPIYFLEAGLDVEVIGNIHDNPDLVEVKHEHT